MTDVVGDRLVPRAGLDRLPAQHRTAVELLLLLSRVSPGPEVGAAAEQVIKEGVDWDFFLAQARRHRVIGLVARNFERLLLWELDAFLYASAETFRAVHLYHQARNATLQRELTEFMPRIAAEVPGVLIRKGLYLAQHIYRDLGSRPMADMDLLMTRRDARRATEILNDLGYAMGDTTPDSRRVEPLPPNEMAFWRMHVNNLPPMFRTTSDPYVREFIVDISVGLFLPRAGFTVPTEEVLGRAVPAHFGDVDILVPAPTDLVLDLCAHLYKESTTLRYLHRLKHQRLIQYCDLRETLARLGGPDFWDRFAALVRQHGVELVAYYALAHLEMLFPGTVPPALLDDWRTGASPTFLDEYATVDLPDPLVWESDFLNRTFAAETRPNLPASSSPV
ncbi:hypothetical protein GCM10010172_65620 [Paractinoplanes ferrugineus]|uniref:Uncharacterized protein n=1 Tax=Paractinoplanes ferrugineus TaxID=113564 RepID=A0A919MMI0_9ACTN|nr:nucleotidyltransferase family protein [Actinoplanes ferrugineus]GIE13277.1 hypothetical protein Afe05nite_51170 [Actinoplanes ferrugineus]